MCRVSLTNSACYSHEDRQSVAVKISHFKGLVWLTAVLVYLLAALQAQFNNLQYIQANSAPYRHKQQLSKINHWLTRLVVYFLGILRSQLSTSEWAIMCCGTNSSRHAIILVTSHVSSNTESAQTMTVKSGSR